MLFNYYFPEEKFYTFKEEKDLSSRLAENLYQNVFSIEGIKFEKGIVISSEELRKPFIFCSRIHLIFAACNNNFYFELPKSDTKFDIHGRLCGWPRDHFCYYEVEPQNGISTDLPQKTEVLKFFKKEKLCQKEINHCYNLKIELYLIDENKITIEDYKKIKSINFKIYR